VQEKVGVLVRNRDGGIQKNDPFKREGAQKGGEKELERRQTREDTDQRELYGVSFTGEK